MGWVHASAHPAPEDNQVYFLVTTAAMPKPSRRPPTSFLPFLPVLFLTVTLGVVMSAVQVRQWYTSSAAVPKSSTTSMATDSVLVLYSGSSPSLVKDLQRYGTVSPKKLESEGATLATLKLAKGKTVASTISALQKNRSILAVQPQYLYEPVLVPNDPFYRDTYNGAVDNNKVRPISGWKPQADYQYYLKDKDNGLHEGRFEQSWSSSTGELVTIALLDSGVDAMHKELGKCDAFAVPNGKCAKIVPGYNAVTKTKDTRDYLGHGTASAGVMVASGNDGVGMTGIAWNAKIRPCVLFKKWPNGQWLTSSELIVDCFDKMLKTDAKIIVLGYASAVSEMPRIEEFVLSRARRKGMLVIAPAGNSGRAVKGGSDGKVVYPAASSYALGVGVVDRNEDRVSYSNYGDGVDLWAHADDFFGVLTLNSTTRDTTYGSALPGNEYFLARGTSIAAPQAAAVAALVWSRYPKLTVSQMEQVLVNGSDYFTATSADPTLNGKGLVSGDRALLYARNFDK